MRRITNIGGAIVKLNRISIKLLAVAVPMAIPLVAFRTKERAGDDAARTAAQECMKNTATSSPPKLITLPSRYIGDRWFVAPVTETGDTVLLFLDTGGGGVWAIKPLLEKLGFKPKFSGIEEGDSTFTGGKFPTFKKGAGIPPPRCETMLAGFGTRPLHEMAEAEGMLGHTWFANRVWVLDYPQRKLAVYDAPPVPRPFDLHTIPMTLKHPPEKNFPRIRVEAAGERKTQNFHTF